MDDRFPRTREEGRRRSEVWGRKPKVRAPGFEKKEDRFDRKREEGAFASENLMTRLSLTALLNPASLLTRRSHADF